MIKKALSSLLVLASLAFAQKTLDQAQGAFEKVSEVAHGNVQMLDAAANAYKNRVTDLQLKSMEFVQLNINSGFAFARKLFAVRDPQEAVNLQQGFFKEQGIDHKIVDGGPGKNPIPIVAVGQAHFGLATNGMTDRKSTRLNSSHVALSRMPSSA